MIKSIVFGAAAGALALAPLSAIAGPYANVEANAGWSGNDYSGSVTDLHLGWEGGDGVYSYYVQAGPAIVQPDGADTEMEFSGKIGGAVAASDALSVYAEISGITGDDDNSYGGKAGVKFLF
tara:strand:+ start:390 stop:755 length:366 start_codon:yes stop_codon:yes gene_type:complete